MFPAEQLKYLVEGGENSATEFKSAGVSAGHLDREMVALANFNGGSILVGVEDDGSVSGVADVAKLEELVAAVSRQNVIPALQAELSNQYFDRYQIDFSAETDKERLLQNADMMTAQGQVTVAGLLLFGIDPQRYLHSAYRYPDKVFRELLVNACAHRNYAISGSQIRVFLFDDRLEFHSPGKLPMLLRPRRSLWA